MRRPIFALVLSLFLVDLRLSALANAEGQYAFQNPLAADPDFNDRIPGGFMSEKGVSPTHQNIGDISVLEGEKSGRHRQGIIEQHGLVCATYHPLNLPSSAQLTIMMYYRRICLAP